jgi:hypothetical protein
MKHSLFIAGIVVVIAIVFLAVVTVIGPMTGRVFSTINGQLSYAEPRVAFGGGSVGSPPMEEMAPAPAADMDAFYDDGQRQRGLDTANTNPQADGPARLVIKNADLTVVVKDPAAKMLAISSMAVTMGGYVVSSSMGETYISDGTKVPQGSIVVRVPEAKLDEALKEIKADVVEVQSETRSGQDVTKEYTDLASQLKNLEATEKKLTEIMDKAVETEDVLAVFNQLTQIRSQIEVIKGQMQYYEQSAAMSAVSVRLVAEQTVQPIKIAGWEPQGDVRDAVQALINFLQGFVTFLIWLVLFALPAVLLVLLPFYLIFLVVRAIVRRNQSKKAVG